MPSKRNKNTREKSVKRGEISLGDLFTAMANLPWQTDQHANLIKNMLGFDNKPIKHESLKSRVTSHANLDINAERSNPLPTIKRGTSSPQKPPLPVMLPDAAPFGSLEYVGIKHPETDESDEDEFLPPDTCFESYDDIIYEPHFHQTIIPQNSIRGILTAMLQVSRENRQIDIVSLIRSSCTGLPLKKIPYQQQGTLAHGCQLLLDYSDSMAPWLNDAQALQKQLQDILGEDKVEILRFNELPLEAEKRSTTNQATDWKPMEGVPILVVTDFGLPENPGSYLLQLRWRQFVSRCKATGVPMVCLVPWWIEPILEQSLGNYPYLFHWLPDTTASEVKALIGTGHLLEP